MLSLRGIFFIIPDNDGQIEKKNELRFNLHSASKVQKERYIGVIFHLVRTNKKKAWDRFLKNMRSAHTYYDLSNSSTFRLL